jgi:DNA polymerase
MTGRPVTVSDLAQSLQRYGIDKLYLSEKASSALAEKRTGPEIPKPGRSNAQTSDQPFVKNYRVSSPETVAEKTERLRQLEEPLRECQECRLHSGRTNLVYGVGNPDADLMFIGEGPGRDEDLKGEPFVGRAGQLLTDMIVKGMKLRRDQVYIANVVKCRPPENRTPEADEMETCVPNLHRQIEIVEPKLIVTLGAVPARGFLGDKTGITKLRGNWRWFGDIPVMPTLHPAYLLRNPAAKKDCWEDLKMAIAYLNGELDLEEPEGGGSSLF